MLVDDPNAHQAPTASQLQKWEEEREEFAKRHIIVNDTKITQNAVGRSMSEDAMRKRKERMERKAARQPQQDTPIDMIPENSPSSGGAEAAPAPDSRSSTPSSNAITAAYPVIIESASSSLDWYDTSATTYDTIDVAQAAGIWSYPSNLSERARCGVFRGLWEQGYFLGGGIKFGGDYLVYPGTSLRGFQSWNDANEVFIR